MDWVEPSFYVYCILVYDISKELEKEADEWHWLDSTWGNDFAYPHGSIIKSDITILFNNIIIISDEFALRPDIKIKIKIICCRKRRKNTLCK